MYIKPALPCLPFFVVFSINLLSRPEREWAGMHRKGVVEPMGPRSTQKARISASRSNSTLIFELRDNVEKVEGRSF